MKTRKWLSILAAMVLCIGMGATQAMAMYGGNMTAYGPGGGFVAGGTNDVAFEITGPLYTSVPGAGAAVNGTIASDNAFFGKTWTTQVWLYGPGTYTVYDGCAPGNPGCGTGTALTFVVGAGEMGGHILFNWSTYSNLDLVTVWSPNTTWATVNGAASFFTGIDNTPPDGAANTKDTTFSWVAIKSKGSVMTAEAGDMAGYGPNFSLQAPVLGGNMTAFAPVGYGGGVAGGTNDVYFDITGALYSSVPGAGAAENATITSDNPFFGAPWTTFVMLYSQGTYTVYDGCAQGNPGCGTGTALTFVVGPGEMGGHILFNWGIYSNLDLVTVWSPNTTWSAVNGTAGFFTGADNGVTSNGGVLDGVANTATTTFSWVAIKSKGSVMTAEAGDMEGYGPNFNLMPIAGTTSKIGIYNNGTWYIDLNGNGAWNGTPTDGVNFLGGTGAVPVTGNWTGTGTTKIGVFANGGTWYLDLNGNGAWDGTPTDGVYFFGGGQTNAIPVTGDWTGTGTTKIGIYSEGIWYLDLNGNGAWDGTPTDGVYFFGRGQTGAIPVTGDWTGTGTTKIGIFANSGTWYLDLNGNGAWDATPTDGLYFFGGGQSGAVPVTGDWDGTGKTKIGVYTNGTWYLDLDGNGAWNGTPTDGVDFFGGQTGAVPVTGKW
jgi:hypothetical protein